MRPAGSPELTCGYDLLWNGLEITTGAQREHRYDVLLRQLMVLLGLSSIREATFLFRGPNRLTP